MNLLRRCLSLLLCFILLSFAFSISASAEEVELGTIKVQQVRSMNGAYSYHFGVFNFYPNNGTAEAPDEYSRTVFVGGESIMVSSYEFSHEDGSMLIPRDRNATIKIDKIYHSSYNKTKNVYIRDVGKVYAVVRYTNGTSEQIEITDYKQNYSPELQLEFTFTPTNDVKSITICVETIPHNFNQNDIVTVYFGEISSDSSFKLVIDQQSEESGLLSGLIEWVKGIFNKIGDIFTAIVEIPGKIWELISEGLKSLFVPSDTYISEFKSDMDRMLDGKLGAVYQVIDITLNSWDRVFESDATNTVDFPEATINFPGGESFTFGGYSILIVPEGFDFLATLCKKICGIVCAFMFVNGLKKRYDEITRG